MLNKILQWLDDRTGYRKISSVCRYLPEGPRWSLVTTSCMFWTMCVVALTGFFLSSGYSSSVSSAWASVHFIEQSTAGSFIRGVHYWGAQILIILCAVHLMRLLLTASFRSPRELLWITSILLFLMVIGLGITGNPLSGTQKGESQIEVEGNIAASIPVVGPVTHDLLIGGDEVGNLTMTRLNFLHTIFLPLAVGLLTLVYFYQNYRLAAAEITDEISVDAVNETENRSTYWPHQSIRNLIALAMVLGGIATLGFMYGAPLEAPIGSETHYIPRPEWYFLFLFELRRFFTGDLEYIATAVIPTLVLMFLMAIPFIDKICSRKISVVLRSLIVVGGIGAWTTLTLASVMRDLNDEDLQASHVHNQELADRARALANRGIPPQGSAELLRHDPKTQGPILFKKHCASCHSHTNEQGEGIKSEKPSAPNLYQFASRRWIAGVLDPEKFLSDHYFGKTAFKEDNSMAERGEDRVTYFLKDKKDGLSNLIAALSAEAKLPSQEKIDQADADKIKQGIKFLKDTDGCAECHKFHEIDEEYGAPDLTNYGSQSWLRHFISDPAHNRFYGDNNDRMPSFAKNPYQPTENLLDQKSVEVLADWIRGDWYKPKKAKKED